jgi:hypothetical protein
VGAARLSHAYTRSAIAGKTGISALARCVIVGSLFLFAPAAHSQDATSEQWIQLFNGRNLDGWIAKVRRHPAGENYANTFRVQDGLLTVAYDDYADFDEQFGHLFYQQPYSHYRLRVEYRFTGQQAPHAPDWAVRNSGVMFHAQAPGTMPADQDFPISLEFQFLGGLSDGMERPTGSVCSPGTHVVYAGKPDETHCIGSSASTYDGNQWVMAEALVLGDERIVHYINGKAVIEYSKPTFGGGVVSGHRAESKPDGKALQEGYIALQSEGHPIQFRRVELLNLKGCMDAQSGNYRSYFVAADAESCR